MNAKHLIAALTAPIALAAAPAGQAATYVFDLTGATTAKFSVDSSLLAPPAESGGDYFIVTNISGIFNGVSRTANSITFNTAAFDGGMTIELGAEFVGLLGAQLFTGATNAPVFRTGRFTLTSDTDGSTSTASISAVPEPMTWTLMIAGVGLVGGSLRRRVRVSYAA